VDTLYTTGFMQLSGDQVEILDVPDAQDRYYVMQYLDAWTNTFAGPGKRLTGTTQQSFALVGPDFDGTPPAGATLIRSPTSLVWLLGRIQVNSTDDIPAVNEFQKQIKLRKRTAGPAGALRRFLCRVLPVDCEDFSQVSPTQLATTHEASARRLAAAATPPETVAAMDAETFFSKAAQLLKESMPPADDAEMVANQLANIGIVPGQDFDWSALPATVRSQLETVPALGLQAIRDFENNQPRVNGWTSLGNSTGGPYGTDYLTRATIAMVGLGANQAAEAVYLSADQDASGAGLSGDEVYEVRFEAGQTPPVKAFWSLTLYDKDHYLVPNAAHKYAIGDRDELIYEEDGSLVLTISATAPSGSANWLPAPAGAPFNLITRAYWPVGGLLDGSWQMPGVVRRANFNTV